MCVLTNINFYLQIMAIVVIIPVIYDYYCGAMLFATFYAHAIQKNSLCFFFFLFL